MLETSPRLGDRYRDAMRRISDYRCSDFDESLDLSLVLAFTDALVTKTRLRNLLGDAD